MKNMFKMMGVALLAGAMLFTACKKDEETTTTTPAAVTTTVVNFDGAEWFTSAKAMKAEASTVAGYTEFKIYKNGATVASAKFSTKTVAGTYGFAEDANCWAVCWGDNDEEYVERDNFGAISISAIDMTAKTMTAGISANVKTAAETEYHTLAIALTNAAWE